MGAPITVEIGERKVRATKPGFVDAIESAETDASDRPVEDQTIERVELED